MLERSEQITAGPDAQDELRRAFGHFATGVTVVTTQSEIGPLGFTANSFSSVSLEPPLVQWSIALSSRRHKAFTTSQRFAIHILAADQVEQALHFATRGDGFDAFDWHLDAAGVPQLAGCLVRIDCRLHAVHPAGDHSLILGEVLDASIAGGDALIFDQGRYGGFLPPRG